MSLTRIPVHIASVLAALTLAAPNQSAGQERFTFELRGTSLVEALDVFSASTGVAVAYETDIVAGLQSFCAAKMVPSEDALRCILDGTGLDFFRMSSGTYVLASAVKTKSLYGYLTGVVLDGESGHPLSRAHVILSEGMRGTVTDGVGRFVFADLLPGEYELAVTHVGYQKTQTSVNIIAGSAEGTVVPLASRTEYVLPVIVDGSVPRSVAELLGRSTAEDRTDRNAAQPRAALYRQLNTLAGIRINDVTADPHIEGGDAGELQFRLDGVPLFLPRRSIGLLGPFSAFALERITVHRTGFGAPLGSFTAGVIEAQHASASRTGSRFQVDATGLNGVLRAAGLGSKVPISAMVAGRVGLWNAYAPTGLKETLRNWTAPDPFLLVAPARLHEYATTDFLTDSLGYSVTSSPDVASVDLHAALRVEPRPLHTLETSVYFGRNGLSNTPTTTLEGVRFTEQATAARLTTNDDHDWRNLAAQMKYSFVWGNRSLVSTQLRGSSYRLDHRYVLIDNIDLGFAPAFDSFDQTTPVSDGNAVDEVGAELRIDHARARHQLQLGLAADAYGSRFDLLAPGIPIDSGISDTSEPLASNRISLDSRFTSDRERLAILAAYANDRFALSQRLVIDGGVRLTYLPDRQTVYAEPRAALTYDARPNQRPSWSSRTAAGLYRQYVTQLDISKLNAGALVPTVRVWLPIDETVRPPFSYHVAQSFAIDFGSGWQTTVEGFARFNRNGLAFDYAVATQPATNVEAQADFLAPTAGRTWGGIASARWTGSRMNGEARYSTTHARRSSDALFAGRSVTVPWVQPHRLDVEVGWRPVDALVVQGRWFSAWDRTWGFRQAYYDFFGSRNDTRLHGQFDFGTPDLDRLPPLHQLDLSVGLVGAFGPVSTQLRIDVLNAIGRTNVADWRLVYDSDQLQAVPRPLYPRVPYVSLQIAW